MNEWPRRCENSPGPDTERTDLPMHDQSSLTAAERENQLDGVLLGQLLHLDNHRPWSVDEIATDLGRDVTDSLERLHAAGLIHRLDRFVWASRAAVVSSELDL
jgi:hypothetical protein